ncbi:MAG: toxin-antitoxin system protein [Clostridia bacterium]|nr:toxin-antitoxin system protein [Clostridia bacterium]
MYNKKDAVDRYHQKPLKSKVSITVDNDLLKWARYMAELDDRSLSQYINLMLRHNFEEKK